jgi:DNA-binding NarL/FixJ family response regulator
MRAEQEALGTPQHSTVFLGKKCDIPGRRNWRCKMSSSSGSSDDSTVLIVEPLPLRNLGLVSVLDRLSPLRKFKIASLPPDDVEKWIRTDAKCCMIIYNVGGASVGDHKHVKRIRSLLRARSADVPLVVFSDSNDRKEVLSALKAGAQGYLHAGTDLHLAQQALSFILEGGSYFPTSKARQGRRPPTLQDVSGAPTELIAVREPANNAAPSSAVPAWTNMDLTARQKAVLERLSRGDSNKAIARRLGIREGTIKVYVRQIMRKLGVTNRTQVAIACAVGATLKQSADEMGGKGKIELSPADGQFGPSVVDPLAGAKRLMS